MGPGGTQRQPGPPLGRQRALPGIGARATPITEEVTRGSGPAGRPACPETMKDILETVAKRLGEAPNLAAELTRRRAEVSDSLHRALDRVREIETRTGGEVAGLRNGDGKPVYGNEAARAAEIARRLAADREYQQARQEADRLRKELAELDARLEEVGRRHRSDASLVYLAASLVSAGMREVAEATLAAYAEGCAAQAEVPPLEEAAIPWDAPETPPARSEEPAPTRPQEPPAKGEADLAEGVFRILEVRPGKSEGTIRAWAEGQKGKVALFAKNSVAKALAGAIGKEVRVKYRKLDKGLFATKVVA